MYFTRSLLVCSSLYLLTGSLMLTNLLSIHQLISVFSYELISNQISRLIWIVLNYALTLAIENRT